MLRIEVLLKNSNLMLAMHRKSESDAALLFDQLVATLNVDKIQLLQLSCERHPKTRIAVLNRDVAAISLTAD